MGVASADNEAPIVALVVRGDHQLNEIKAENLAQVATPLTFATDEQILATVNCNAGSIGPVGLNIDVIVDISPAIMAVNVNPMRKEKVGFSMTT